MTGLDTIGRLAARGPAYRGPNLRWESPASLIVLIVLVVLLSVLSAAG